MIKMIEKEDLEKGVLSLNTMQMCARSKEKKSERGGGIEGQCEVRRTQVRSLRCGD